MGYRKLDLVRNYCYMQMKIGIIIVVLFRVFLSLKAVNYEVADWTESGFGNHRARLRVTQGAEAVAVEMPWRRRDAAPESKAIYVYDAAGKKMTDVCMVEIAQEYGKIIFRPASGAGEYYVYYLPYKLGTMTEEEEYDKPENTAAKNWLKQYSGQFDKLPHAELVSFQSRKEFNSFYPMEVCATKAETEALKNRFATRPFVIFPEDRAHDIRMTNRLPLRWIERGPASEFIGQAQPGEYYPFQLGIWAHRKNIGKLTLKFTALENKATTIDSTAMTCFNTEGVDIHGRDFQKTLSVETGNVQPLWIGIDVPKDASGQYHGKITVTDETTGETEEVAIHLSVSGDVLADGGVSDINRLSRLKWLNSRQGENDTVLPQFQPVRLEGNQLYLKNRSVKFNEQGFPAQIYSNNREILSAPVQLVPVISGKESAMAKVTGPTEIVRSSDSLVECLTRMTYDSGVRADVTSTSESDGCIQYKVKLSVDNAVKLDDLKLRLPVNAGLAKYWMGMEKRGGFRCEPLDWKWKDKYINNGIWLGDVNAGIQLKLQSPTDPWALWALPIEKNTHWDNNGQGGCRSIETGDQLMLEAYCGSLTIQPDNPLELRFRLMITPFKEISAKHWDYRINDNMNSAGSKIFHLHHGSILIPYINYPFTNMDGLKNFITNLRSAYFLEKDKGSLTYDLTDVFNPEGGALHFKVTANFNSYLRKPQDDHSNQRLMTLDFGDKNGRLGFYWNTDDCGMRSYYQAGPASSSEFPTQIWGTAGEYLWGNRYIVSICWGKEMKIFINGKLMGSTPMPKLAKTDLAQLKLEGGGFLVEEIKLTGNYEGGNVDQPKALWSKKFHAPQKFVMPREGSLTLNVKSNFDSSTGVRDDDRYNRYFLDMKAADGRRQTLYWNYNDQAFRCIVEDKGNYPLNLVTAKTEFTPGESHRIKLDWSSRKLSLSMDGKALAETGEFDTASVLPVGQEIDLKVIHNGFELESFEMTDLAGKPAVEFKALPLPADGKADGVGYVSWNGLRFSANLEKREAKDGQIYYTVRELSNHCRELWALRSLGNEIFTTETGLTYTDMGAFVFGANGGYPWLREHLGSGYVPGWRTTWLPEAGLPGDFCAAITTRSDSRLLNYYLEGIKWLFKETGISGLYLDGIGYDREIMKRVARTMNESIPGGFRINSHCSDLYEVSRTSALNQQMEHLPYLTDLWIGEYYNYNRGPDYFLVEVSGLPFGITSEMLHYENGGNRWRGMIYGMSGRFLKDVESIWRFWDQFGIKDSAMRGYWDPECPVSVDSREVKATAYVKGSEALIALAHWPADTGTRRAVIPAQSDLEKGALLSRFSNYGDANLTAPGDQTRVYATVTGKQLQLRFICNQQSPVNAKKRPLDGPVWDDDSMEIFLQPNLADKTYYQFIVNAAGSMYDGKVRDSSWNGNWKAKVEKTASGWQADVTIPLADIGLGGWREGQEIGVNFCRHIGNRASCWSSPDGSFHNSGAFGRLVLAGNAGAVTRDRDVSDSEVRASLQINLSLSPDIFPGFNPDEYELWSPPIPSYQEEAVFRTGEKISIQKSQGRLLWLRRK